jgi:ADP-ribosylglycohydrolase
VSRMEKAIINSALWAAAGDAIGWISELTDSNGIKRRTGFETLSKTVSWKRKIGGIGGVIAELPVGTYSDDTQLRLAVSRSIRSDSTFDVEVFAKIELTVWPSYALGGGRGSKQAAANLCKRDVNWFSNFFPTYTDAGGNGAAMRIQPHVWLTHGNIDRTYIKNVICDSITTHGHMRGICGAMFHADCVAFALREQILPGPIQWREFIKNFRTLLDVINSDISLRKFWLPTWERISQTSIDDAIEGIIEETLDYIWRIEDINAESVNAYKNALNILGGYDTRKGTGTNTAISAAYLAWSSYRDGPEMTLLRAANELNTDTDTIATMAGAILGSLENEPPKWLIQDFDYIQKEAKRIYAISENKFTENFPYPDTMNWVPPQSQSDAVSYTDRSYFVAGLGHANKTGKSWENNNFSWEWFKLDFGQSILCKHKKFAEENNKNFTKKNNDISNDDFKDRSSIKYENFNLSLDEHDAPEEIGKEKSLEEITDIVIRSGFDPRIIGENFLECIKNDQIERGIAFSAIISKAIIARKKKKSL